MMTLSPEGWTALEQLHHNIPDHAILLADAKRGDIGSTATAYATAILDRVRAHAVTINPLMGHDCVEPFLTHHTKPLIYLLALTSNPGASDFLTPTTHDNQTPLAIQIATKANDWNAATQAIGLVVGATRSEADLRAIHHAAPALPWLVPGVGAQGGSIQAVAEARDNALSPAHLLVHATRSIMPEPDEPASAIKPKAQALHAQLNQATASV